MKSLYQSMAKAVEGKYFRDSKGEVVQITGLESDEKHDALPAKNIFTGGEVFIDIHIKEYAEVSKRDWKQLYMEAGRRFKKTKRRLEEEV